MSDLNTSLDLLSNYLNKNKIATINEIKRLLNTQSRMTIYRKLSYLDYISSGSHRGKYYSLKQIAKYNEYGLWVHKGILFSQNKTLKNTLNKLIDQSTQGYNVAELKEILNVKVDDTLLVSYTEDYKQKYKEIF